MPEGRKRFLFISRRKKKKNKPDETLSDSTEKKTSFCLHSREAKTFPRNLAAILPTSSTTYTVLQSRQRQNHNHAVHCVAYPTKRTLSLVGGTCRTLFQAQYTCVFMTCNRHSCEEENQTKCGSHSTRLRSLDHGSLTRSKW